MDVQRPRRAAARPVVDASRRRLGRDIGRARKAAQKGPVYTTDRGRPAHVLLTSGDHEHLPGPEHITDARGEPVGVEDVELMATRSDDLARPASFDR